MSQATESLEWQSVKNALRDLQADDVRALLSQKMGVVAYTDGACVKNPGGPAGWSAILFPVEDLLDGLKSAAEQRIECHGHIPRATTTTNNRAEISAVLAALSLAPLDRPLKIYSDSEYTIKVATGVFQMKANPDLWELFRMLRNHRKAPLTFEWVRGHAGHNLNERADELAGLGAWNDDHEAYERWQASQAPEAHNTPADTDLAALREQVLRLQTFFDSDLPNTARVAPNERQFVNDMAKRLRRNGFAPSEKQRNWVRGLLAKYKL